ncbi:fibronectin type III domain-containing protein [Micromonospora sp. DT229]
MTEEPTPAEFTNLKPDTRYTYRVGDGTNWSEWTDFTTAVSTLTA